MVNVGTERDVLVSPVSSPLLHYHRITKPYPIPAHTHECIIPEPHSLWFPNAPPTASPALVAQQIFGGPLESIRWYEHYDDHGLSYLINFLNHEDAKSFLNFSRTPGYRMTFPGADDDWRPYLTWSTNPGTIRAHIRRAAYNMNNPARRVLVFQNFPAESVSKFEMKRRLKALERQFFVEHWVDTYKIYPHTAAAYIVFSKIESAMRVMEWHGVGLLGPEFNDCVVMYGRDPSDQPFPVVGEDGIFPSFPPDLILIILLIFRATIVITDLSPPLSNIVFQSPVILATTPPCIPSPPALPATLLTTIPRVPPVDFPMLIDISAWVESHSPAPSITSLETPASSPASSENLLGDSPPVVYLNPARAMEMTNFSDLFFAQEWDGR